MDNIDTDTLIITKAHQLVVERRRAISIDEAASVGMSPVIDGQGAWGVSADIIFELDTAITTEQVAILENQAEADAGSDLVYSAGEPVSPKEVWAALDSTHAPSGRGLKRVSSVEITTDTPLYPSKRER